MKKMTATVVILGAAAAVLALAGKAEPHSCAGHEPAAEEAAAAAVPADLPEGAVHVGQALEGKERVTLSTVRANPDRYFEKTLLVEADASAVCQAKGCWLTISDGDGEQEPIWVRWSSGCGGKYEFPKDLAGRRVLIQGSFYAKEIDEKAAEHLAGESKDLKADEIVGKTFEMNATACVILPAEPAAETTEG